MFRLHLPDFIVDLYQLYLPAGWLTVEQVDVGGCTCPLLFHTCTWWKGRKAPRTETRQIYDIFIIVLLSHSNNKNCSKTYYELVVVTPFHMILWYAHALFQLTASLIGFY